MAAIRLPHPELVAWTREMRRRVLGTRHVNVAATVVTYRVFEHDPDATRLPAAYDESGAILVSSELVALDPAYADLIAFHEHEEIRHKRAGRSHAYAHRSAWVAELLAAKAMLADVDALMRYLDWRVGGYPPSKVLDPHRVALQLADILSQERVRKGLLRQAITEHRL